MLTFHQRGVKAARRAPPGFKTAAHAFAAEDALAHQQVKNVGGAFLHDLQPFGFGLTVMDQWVAKSKVEQFFAGCFKPGENGCLHAVK